MRVDIHIAGKDYAGPVWTREDIVKFVDWAFADRFKLEEFNAPTEEVKQAVVEKMIEQLEVKGGKKDTRHN